MGVPGKCQLQQCKQKASQSLLCLTSVSGSKRACESKRDSVLEIKETGGLWRARWVQNSKKLLVVGTNVISSEEP